MAEEILARIVDKLDRLSEVPKERQRARDCIALEVDDFLSQMQRSPTSRVTLETAEMALSQCNLPLTKIIFECEAKIAVRQLSRPGLVISPSVAVSAVVPKRVLRSVGLQFESIDPKAQQRIAGEVAATLTQIRNDLSAIAQRHERHKLRRREINRLLQLLESDDT
jgi:hypothetical protein